MEIFDRYGYYKESLQSLTLKGKGEEQIKNILEKIPAGTAATSGRKAVIAIEDYKTSVRKDMKEEKQLLSTCRNQMY